MIVLRLEHPVAYLVSVAERGVSIDLSFPSSICLHRNLPFSFPRASYGQNSTVGGLFRTDPLPSRPYPRSSWLRSGSSAGQENQIMAEHGQSDARRVMLKSLKEALSQVKHPF